MKTETQAMSAGSFELVLDQDQPYPLETIKGVGAKTAEKFAARGIDDCRDLLMWTPRKYRACAHFFKGPQMELARRSWVEFVGEVSRIISPRKNSRAPTEVVVDVDGALFRLVWFNMHAGFFRKMSVGSIVHVRGEVSYDRGHPQMAHPDIDVLGNTQVVEREPYLSVEPVYTSIEGVSDKLFRKALEQAAETLLPRLVDVVPQGLREKHGLPTVAQAFEVIHLLRNYREIDVFTRALDRARRRLVYEEFYTLQRELVERYIEERRAGRAPVCAERELGREFVRALPFKLTGDQGTVIAEIADDLRSKRPMRRLLQGDVGSGKTVVALMAAAIAIGSGQQVVMMAPTDILARQHLARAREFFEGLGVRVELLSGSQSQRERDAIGEELAASDIDLLVGTHAVFQEDVVYAHLGLVIIDEQHKFGVVQREQLMAKGRDPHLLAMTATPIPRSLAHAVYGDLELSVIREKPPGRKPIRTFVRLETRAPRVYDWVAEQIREKQVQAYFVYPMIEGNEDLANRKSAVEAAEELVEGRLKGLRVEVLHGKMSADDKERIMGLFAAGEVDVLCATTVVEVGVDVSNATLMIIESAEVFGLSQLHQLRGRVGRGEEASSCVLLAGMKFGKEAHARLTVFKDTDDGFVLAEEDMRIRGPGLFLGVRQAGRAEFRFGDLLRDAELLEIVREDVRRQMMPGMS